MYTLENLIIVRGGGDIATGTISKLYKSGFPVLILETETPSAIRRNVAFSEAVYTGSQRVEDVTATLVSNVKDAYSLLRENQLPVLIDPQVSCLSYLQPLALVDAILAKKNLGTKKNMATITVALGPGFTAGKDVDAVVETNRGHHLGKIYYSGSAAPNTGVPGKIAGFDKERVIHSPASGILHNVHQITDLVKKEEVIAYIDTGKEKIPVPATLDGLLRGLIRDGYPVTKGFKIADIDPRKEEYDNCFTISDKARCIAGGVLEAILYLKKEKHL